jgi:putative FmdB family regulatory protein
MPTYEYECQQCGHHMESFQSIMAKPLKKCPQCGKNKLQRLIGAGAGLIFRGPGFYSTDYRSESYKAAAKAETSSPSPPPAKPEETTPAPAKTEAKSETPSKKSKAQSAA